MTAHQLLGKLLDSTDWFSVAPATPHGQKPLLGTLHSSLMRAVEAAYRASRD